MKREALLKNSIKQLTGRGDWMLSWAFAFWLVVALLATGQDALFAFLKNTSFYWSESLLYKIYWLLFIPLTALVALVARKYPVKKVLSHNTFVHALLAILTSLIQVLIFSVLMAFLSEMMLGYNFQFEGVLRKALADDYFTGVLMYGLLLMLSHRFEEKSAVQPLVEKVEKVINGKEKVDYLNAFLVKDGAKTQRIPVVNIDWIGSEDSYTMLHQGGQKWLYSESLSKLEKQLNPSDFIRIHRSCIVNIHRVKKVTSRLTGDYDVNLDQGTTVRLSRHYVHKAHGLLI